MQDRKHVAPAPYYVTGVVFASEDSPTHRLRRGDGEGTHIPTHFYKALYTPAHGGQAIAFVFENDDASGPLSAGAVLSASWRS